MRKHVDKLWEKKMKRALLCVTAAILTLASVMLRLAKTEVEAVMTAEGTGETVAVLTGGTMALPTGETTANGPTIGMIGATSTTIGIT